MEAEIVANVMANLPNFAGFSLFAFAMWRIVNRQLDMQESNTEALRQLIDQCCDDENEIQTQSSRVNHR
jgi:hypothetical protein